VRVISFQTPRLRLREMTDADLDDVFSLLGDAVVMRYYPRTRTRAEAQDWIRWNGALYRSHGFGLWLMTRTDTGEFVGQCGLSTKVVDDVEETEIGWHVRPEHQGHGYATEAALACCDLGRNTYGLKRLISIIAVDNRPSQRVAEKIGLTVEKRSVVSGFERLIYAGDLQQPSGSDTIAGKP
jgi:RimJ/RimL family protein N-acetyltransferase